jgi:hypothetical protein
MVSEGRIMESATGPVVTAMVHLKADTSKIETISASLSELNFIEDIYLLQEIGI